MPLHRISTIAAVSALILTLTHAPADAGWLLDHERFHMSVHGQLSCQDCHSDIVEKAKHPDPVNVNRGPAEFFEIDSCAACHEGVIEEISEGSHAGQDVSPGQNFETCIECHHPHYQLRPEAGENLVGKPASVRCASCHDYQARLPEFIEDDQPCLQCHLESGGQQGLTSEINNGLCLHCHSSENRQDHSFALIDMARYAATPHADIDCRVCHPQAAAYGHGDQRLGDCRQCHQPHDEKINHDLHGAVSCGACHLKGVELIRDDAGGNITWRRPPVANRISPIHDMQVPEGEASCRACHTGGNNIGAAAMVLPAKSMICMPCHAATISIGDTVTIVSLLLFFASLTSVASVWFAGRGRAGSFWQRITRWAGTVSGMVFSSRILGLTRSLVLDGLFQRRLLAVSKERWLLHALIFYPFLFRFIWGLVALIGSVVTPPWASAWVMLDKNHPLTAFLFDISGLLIIIGLGAMILRSLQKRSSGSQSGLPPVDWPAYALLASIMISGFILEGMRMSMTGSPAGASYAFVGDAISRLLAGLELTGFYGYLWYLHAILTGAFLVYLPFSRMLHMILAPLVLAINAAEMRLEGGEAGKLGS